MWKSFVTETHAAGVDIILRWFMVGDIGARKPGLPQDVPATA
jgi:hypothetical protein